jgi:hypothetical protein
MNKPQTIVRLFFGIRSLIRAPAPIQIMTKTPWGMPRRAVLRVLKPRPLMTRVEKFEIPPLGMLAINPRS